MRQATHIIQVNKCSDEAAWYSCRIGSEFGVYQGVRNVDRWVIPGMGEHQGIYKIDSSVLWDREAQEKHQSPQTNTEIETEEREWAVLDAVLSGGSQPNQAGILTTQIGGNHYKDSKIQPVEFIEANNIPFLEGCVIKRCCRHAKKNGIEDIEKAIHELKLIAKFRYGKEIA